MAPICLFLLLVFSTGLNLALEPAIGSLSSAAQQYCVEHSPKLSIYNELYSAIVCGENVSISTSIATFKSTGLFHLLVVSGAHLTFLTMVLTHMFGNTRKSQILIFAALVTFTLFAGAQPPLVRSLLQLLALFTSTKFKMNWSKFDLILFSGIAGICLFPSWLISLSFWLSWLATLSTCFAQAFFKGEWAKTIAIHLLFLPALSAFGTTHPLTLVYNLILAPILGGILFPLSLITFFFSPFARVADLAWVAFGHLLELSQHLLPFHLGMPSALTLAITTLFAQNFLHILWVLWRRSTK